MTSQKEVHHQCLESNMKLTLKITLGYSTNSIIASVGNGNGTIKWLSLMAAQRYVHQTSNGVIGSLRKSQLLPKNIYTDSSPFLHPDGIINKCLQDGQVVYIELYDHIPLDEFNVPQYSPFACIAFCVSDSKAQIREKLTLEKQLEAKEFNEIKAKEAEEQRIASNRPKLQKMRTILMEQLRNEIMTTTSITNVWLSIVNCGVLDSLVPSSSEQKEIKNFFTKNYEEISQLYKYYSAVNSGGGTHTLEYIEFTKFLYDTNIFQTETLQSNLITKMFGATPSTIHSEIIQWEFFASCIKIAIYKYITLVKKKMASLKKRGHRIEIGQTATPTPSKALQMLYDEYLLPVIDRLPASKLVKNSMDSEDTLLFFYQHLNELTRIFHKFSDTNLNINDLDGIRELGAMNLQQFIAFASDFLGPIHFISSTDVQSEQNVIKSSNFFDGNDEVTLKEVRQIFSASQHDTAMNDVELQFLEDDSHKETMVFPEFIEAIVRLGFLKYSRSDDCINHSQQFECIRMAVTKILASNLK